LQAGQANGPLRHGSSRCPSGGDSTPVTSQVARHGVLANSIEAITRIAVHEQADLIVVGDSSPRWVYRSAKSDALVEKADCSVLVVYLGSGTWVQVVGVGGRPRSRRRRWAANVTVATWV
jgi:hypothetical protein